MTTDLPSPDTLRQLLTYDPDTGKLFWRERDRGMFRTDRDCNAWNARLAGKEAFACLDPDYKIGSIYNRKHKAHRVIWAIYYGHWPKYQIDHINCDKSDNRIKNLRDVPQLVNQKNRPMQANNTSKFTGVHWYKPSGKWMAHITVNKKSKTIGYFSDINDAIAARAEAEQGQGFTERHGK